MSHNPLKKADPVPSLQPLTFPLRWRLYSLVYFLVIGTSISLSVGPILLIIPLIPLLEILPDPRGRYYLLFTVGWWFLWFGARLVRDFRTKITFTPSEIILRTPRIKHPLPWLRIARVKQQTFTWAEIEHIELLPDLIAVQFPTMAVVLRPAPHQHAQFLALTKTYLPAQHVLTEGQMFYDLRSEDEFLVAWILLTGGAIVGFLGFVLASIINEWLFWVIFLYYWPGYLLVGGMNHVAMNRHVVLTSTGILSEWTHRPRIHNSQYILHYKRLPPSHFPVPPPWNAYLAVSWIPWKEITRFGVYYDRLVVQSTQGLLEIIGLEEKEEVKAWILNRVVTEPTQWRIASLPKRPFLIFYLGVFRKVVKKYILAYDYPAMAGEKHPMDVPTTPGYPFPWYWGVLTAHRVNSVPVKGNGNVYGETARHQGTLPSIMPPSFWERPSSYRKGRPTSVMIILVLEFLTGLLFGGLAYLLRNQSTGSSLIDIITLVFFVITVIGALIKVMVAWEIQSDARGYSPAVILGILGIIIGFFFSIFRFNRSELIGLPLLLVEGILLFYLTRPKVKNYFGITDGLGLMQALGQLPLSRMLRESWHRDLTQRSISELIHHLKTESDPFTLLDVATELGKRGNAAREALPLIKQLQERFYQGAFGRWEKWKAGRIDELFRRILENISHDLSEDLYDVFL